MAVPANMTTLDLSGKYVQNKTLSDNTDDLLTKQGVSFFTRKAVNMGTVTLFVKHERPADGVETITVDQSLSGGFGASSESRILDWEQRSADSKLYGKTFIRTKRVTVDELDNAWLKEGWVDEVREHGLILNSVQSEPKNGKTWYTDITWGVEEIGEAKRYTRHVAFSAPNEKEINVRLVYDYQGPLN